ncbi:MAG TPA: hypothetical protein DIC60_08150 [Lachnospiraceae bacterium]|nr:hypothetical protein [Lachnospiraceae bacterium]
MRNTGNYACALKGLISMTNMKMMYIAKAVDYDISYISKWCNNNKLPPKKNVSSINERLAVLFADEVIAQNIFSRLCRELSLFEVCDGQNEREIAKEEIYKVLMAAFEISERSAPLKDGRKQESTNVLIGKNKILEYVAETVRAIIEESDKDIEMICTMDINSILEVYGVEKLRPYKLKNIRVFASLGLNMKSVAKESDEAITRMYNLLNIKLECEITLFDNFRLEKFNVLVIKDKIAFVFSVDNDGIMEIATQITDKEIVNKIYLQTDSKLRITDIIVKPEDSLSLEQGGYRTKFYTASDFDFFSAYGFEFLLPPDVVEQIAREAVVQSGDEKMASVVKRLQITWEERFVNGEINFILPKSTVLRYIEKGVMFYMDTHFVTTVEQRRCHVKQFVENMKNNRKIRFSVMDDDYFYYPEDFFQLSVYFNNCKLFLKKNSFSVNNSSSKFYVLTNEKMIKYIRTYFQNMVEKPYCKTYTAEEIEEIVNKNEKMILRMLDL